MEGKRFLEHDMNTVALLTDKARVGTVCFATPVYLSKTDQFVCNDGSHFLMYTFMKMLCSTKEQVFSSLFGLHKLFL